jgi:site-specific recombinase XerC
MANHSPKNIRSTVKAVLTPDLIEALDFSHWPVSPAKLVGKKLVTEPTPPHVKEWVVRDIRTPGFGIRVYAGAKSFFVQRKSGGSTSRRYTLFEQKTLTSARDQATSWYAEMKDPGFDPKKDLKDRAQVVKEMRDVRRVTFGHAYEDFVQDGATRVKDGTLRPKTLDDRKQVTRWMQHMDLWSTPLIDVDVSWVDKTFTPLFRQAAQVAQAKLESIGPNKRGGGAGTDLSAVYKCLTHCTTTWNESSEKKVPANPFSAWRKGQKKLPKVKRRTTMLSTTSDKGVAWLKGLLALCDSMDPAEAMLADYVLLSVLWGGRKTEESLLRWRDVNFDLQKVCFSAATTKGNKDHEIPLTPWAIDLLLARRTKNLQKSWSVGPNDFVFPYPHTKSGRIEDYRPITRLLLEQTGLWVRLHDLRRTFASAVFGSAKDLGTVAIALGHATGQDVTMGYLQGSEAINALRELYVAREINLRKLVGLDAPTPEDQALTATQIAIVDSMRDMMKKHGLNAISEEKLLSALKG